VAEDKFYVLGEGGGAAVPNFMMPPILMNNHGNYIVSMGNVCRWMAEQAEELGVEIFPGMAVPNWSMARMAKVKRRGRWRVRQGPDGTPGTATSRAWSWRQIRVLLAKGVRGSLAKEVIAKYDLDSRARSRRNSASA
jgi:electron-transferring-flavoprotein dehydrogenase